MDQPRTYTLTEVADLIEDQLGSRPSDWALRHPRPTPAGQTSRPRTGNLVEGLPAPLNNPKSPPAPTTWDARLIDQWLADHPTRRRQAARDALAEAAAAGQLEQGVDAAVAARLSWRTIAETVNAATGQQTTHETFRARYRRRHAQD